MTTVGFPFSKWYGASKLPLFPEYTDHGPKHVQGVLETAEALIPAKAFAVLTDKDVAALLLSCLVHDAAMHLTEDAFIELLDGSKSRPVLTTYRDQPWDEEWTRYLGIVSRFDGRQLKKVLGASEPVQWNRSDFIEHRSELQRKLVGEFVRRHHPRLAHELAVLGIPGVSQQQVTLQGVDSDTADIIGLVARSHGHPIRWCFAHRSEEDLRHPGGVYAVYLMVLLRLADYLQMQPGRAPKDMLKVMRLRVPFSEGEWDVHGAVKGFDDLRDDPESIFVDADPRELETFLRLTKWLHNVQAEFDTSWAVLGEVYGRYMPQLGLSLRRVRSSIDDVGKNPPSNCPCSLPRRRPSARRRGPSDGNAGICRRG